MQIPGPQISPTLTSHILNTHVVAKSLETDAAIDTREIDIHHAPHSWDPSFLCETSKFHRSLKNEDAGADSQTMKSGEDQDYRRDYRSGPCS